MKKPLSDSERRNMQKYVDHSMDIGGFDEFVKENRVRHGVLYRGLRLHESLVEPGEVLEHFEPLLSCSQDIEVTHAFAVNGLVPEDIVTDELKARGLSERSYGDVYQEFVPVVLELHGVKGVRLLDYLEDDYEYASEKEVVVLNEPLVVHEVHLRKTRFNETYHLVVVTMLGEELEEIA